MSIDKIKSLAVKEVEKQINKIDKDNNFREMKRELYRELVKTIKFIGEEHEISVLTKIKNLVRKYTDSDIDTNKYKLMEFVNLFTDCCFSDIISHNIGDSFLYKIYKGTRDYFPYVPSDNYMLVQCNNREFLEDGNKFLDIGCGIGKIPTIYWLMTGKKSVGIEYSSILSDIGNAILYYIRHVLDRDYSDALKIFNMDAFNFYQYGEYDRLYTYMPIKSNNLRLQLYIHIANQVKNNAGTMWMEVEGVSTVIDALTFVGAKFERVSVNIFKIYGD